MAVQMSYLGDCEVCDGPCSFDCRVGDYLICPACKRTGPLEACANGCGRAVWWADSCCSLACLDEAEASGRMAAAQSGQSPHGAEGPASSCDSPSPDGLAMLLTTRFPIGVPVTFYEPAFGSIAASVVAHDVAHDRVQVEFDEYEPGALDDLMDGLRVSGLTELFELHRSRLIVRRWWDAEEARVMELARLLPAAETAVLAQRLRAWAGKA